MTNQTDTSIRRLRLLRRAANGLRNWWPVFSAMRAEAELRAMDERELHDLGLDRGGIAYAAHCGRDLRLGVEPASVMDRHG